MTVTEDLTDPNALLTPGEVASLFRVTPKTITRWAEAGKLPAIRTLRSTGASRPAACSPPTPRCTSGWPPATPDHRGGWGRQQGRGYRRPHGFGPLPPSPCPSGCGSPTSQGSSVELAMAIGEAGGNIVAFEGFEARDEYLDEDLIVNCTSEAHILEVADAIRELDGVEVISVSDRLRHAPGRQDRGAGPHGSKGPRRPLHGVHAGRGPGLHRHRGAARARARAHHQEEHGGHRHRRHRRARAGRHRPPGRPAGHGGQGPPVQELRRRRRLPHLHRRGRPRHPHAGPGSTPWISRP